MVLSASMTRGSPGIPSQLESEAVHADTYDHKSPDLSPHHPNVALRLVWADAHLYRPR